MKPRQRLLLPGLLVLVALLALTGRPDVVIESVDDEQSDAARDNDLLALGQLAQLLGATVSFHAQLPPDALPPPDGGMLWLPVPGAMLGDARTGELLNWVRAGGTLVIAPRMPQRWADDPLLLAAGIHFSSLDSDELQAAYGEEPPWRYARTHGVPYAIDSTHALAALPDTHSFVASDHDDASGLLCDPGGCHATRVPLGAGAILALADPDMFGNNGIGDFDHATLARHLLGLSPQRTLWIVHEERVPTLFELLWRHAQPALLAALVAIALWLFAAGSRFGPAQASPEPARRRLAEHVEAVGLLLAGHGARQRLWQAARDDFIRALHRRHPQARGVGEQAMITLIARHAGVDEADVRAAMIEPVDRQAAPFAAAIRRLEILRRKL